MCVRACVCNGNSWLNKTSYLPHTALNSHKPLGGHVFWYGLGDGGGLAGVSAACPAIPGVRIWLKTKVKTCLISPVKAVITNKHRVGLRSSPG